MRRPPVLAVLAVALVLAAGAAQLASSAPDGLERVAADHGFADRGRENAGPAAGYTVRGLRDDRLARALAGAGGVLGVFALAYGVAAVVRRRGAGHEGSWPGSATTRSS